MLVMLILIREVSSASTKLFALVLNIKYKWKYILQAISRALFQYRIWRCICSSWNILFRDSSNIKEKRGDLWMSCRAKDRKYEDIPNVIKQPILVLLKWRSFATSQSENKSWNSAFKSRHGHREKWDIVAFNVHLISAETAA